MAAAAVRMARERQREAEMIDWLTGALPAQRLPDDVRRAAERILGPLDFDKELARHRDAIDRDIAEAQRLLVRGMPTAFVNGIAVRPDNLRAAIDAALAGVAPGQTGVGPVSPETVIVR